MIVGDGACLDAMNEDIAASNPINLCNQPMPVVSEAKYFGDWISEEGLSASVVCTVKKRKGLTISAIHEIRSVVWWNPSRIRNVGACCPAYAPA